MNGDADIASVATLLADGSRAAICAALLDGRFRTAGELARVAGVTASTASEHLGKLVDGGLLEVTSGGRHRYYRLAGADVANALESLALIAPVSRASSYNAVAAGRALREGRTCYDHLAGSLGMRFTDGLIAAGVITADWSLGDTAPLRALGLTWETSGRSPDVRACVDWTERRFHVAGRVPATLTHQLLERSWIRRIGQGRAVRLTDAGEAALAPVLRAERRQAS